MGTESGQLGDGRLPDIEHWRELNPRICERSNNFRSVTSGLVQSHSIAPVNRTASAITWASSRMVKSSP